MRLIYHPDAEAELIESARFYEQRVPSLGGQFLDAAELAIGAILDAPERWSILEAGVRRYLMPVSLLLCITASGRITFAFWRSSITAAIQTICAIGSRSRSQRRGEFSLGSDLLKENRRDGSHHGSFALSSITRWRACSLERGQSRMALT